MIIFINSQASTMQCRGGKLIGGYHGDDDAQGKGEVTMIIFINSQASTMQCRGGKLIGGYHGQIDVIRRTLEWSAQRGDKNNTRVQALIDHIDGGGRLVVGVRGSAG